MYWAYTFFTEHHDPKLVLLAAVVCFIAAATALGLVQRARLADGRLRRLWIAAASVASGCGIWATHFTAMLAYRPGLPISYDLGLTLLSILVAIAVTGGGIALFLRAAGRRSGAVLGGAVIGLGIAAMHFVGMLAVRVPARIEIASLLAAAALAIGVLFAVLALRALSRGTAVVPRITAAALLSLAVCGLHFTAMAALELLPDPLVAIPAAHLQADWLAVGVSVTTLLVLGLSLVGSVLDQHRIQLSMREADALRQSETRLRELANATFEGIVVHRDGQFVDANQAFYRLLDRQSGTGGVPALERILPGLAGQPPVSGVPCVGDTLETELIRPDGSRVPVELLTRQIRWGGGAIPARVTSVRDLSEHKRAQAEIQHLFNHDALTGLPNRRQFMERLTDLIARARHRGTSLAVLLLDLDHFREINDIQGQEAGDALLRMVAERLSDRLREIDTLGRLGGDEFAVVQSDLHGPGEVAGLAQRLLQAFAEPFQLDGTEVSIEASMGIAIHPSDGDQAEALLRNAVKALDRSKTEGGRSYRYFEPEMDASQRERRELEQDLRRAIDSGGLALHYQPQLDCWTGEISGFEALVRWPHPERGMISPGQFIPLAEETGLIIALGDWVLRQAIREASSWPGTLRIGVNLSAVQFRDGGLPEVVAGYLEQFGLAPERLELEITESLVMSDSQATLDQLGFLKSLGVRIAMDDFGTGYSSLGYLRRYPFDKLKIDRSFVLDLETDQEARTIVRAVVGLARGLGLPVTAEGVERREQLEILTEEGCDEVQGFLLGRPMPASMLAGYLESASRGSALTDATAAA